MEENPNFLERAISNAIKQVITDFFYGEEEKESQPKKQESPIKKLVRKLTNPAIFVGFGWLTQVAFTAFRMRELGKFAWFSGILAAIAAFVSSLMLFVFIPEPAFASPVSGEFAPGKPGFPLVFIIFIGLVAWGAEMLFTILRNGFMVALTRAVSSLLALTVVGALAWKVVDMVIGWTK